MLVHILLHHHRPSHRLPFSPLDHRLHIEQLQSPIPPAPNHSTHHSNLSLHLAPFTLPFSSTTSQHSATPPHIPDPPAPEPQLTHEDARSLGLSQGLQPQSLHPAARENSQIITTPPSFSPLPSHGQCFASSPCYSAVFHHTTSHRHSTAFAHHSHLHAPFGFSTTLRRISCLHLLLSPATQGKYLHTSQFHQDFAILNLLPDITAYLSLSSSYPQSFILIIFTFPASRLHHFPIFSCVTAHTGPSSSRTTADP